MIAGVSRTVQSARHMAILRAMGFIEYLEQVRAEVEGDAFFRLLKSHLSAGHRIQKVTFAPAEGRRATASCSRGWER